MKRIDAREKFIKATSRKIGASVLNQLFHTIMLLPSLGWQKVRDDPRVDENARRYHLHEMLSIGPLLRHRGTAPIVIKEFSRIIGESTHLEALEFLADMNAEADPKGKKELSQGLKDNPDWRNQRQTPDD